MRCKPLLRRSGKALADGEGRNGVWLAKQRLEVTSTDFSPSAQVKGRKLAAEHNVIQGYTPKQLVYGTGGPKNVEQLYTREMLERGWGDFKDVKMPRRNARSRKAPAIPACRRSSG